MVLVPPTLTLKPKPKPKPAGLAPGAGFTNQWQQIVSLFGKQDPAYAPTPDETIRSNAAAAVKSIVDPQLDALNKSFQGRLDAGLKSIYGYGDALRERLDPMAGTVKGYYGQAEGDLRAEDAALREFLGGTGAAGSADVRARLDGVLPQEAVDAAAAGAGGIGAGAAAESAARGFNLLNRTIGDRAADLSYFAKLPAIGDLQTGQQAGAFRGQIGQEFADRSGEITAAVPGLVQSLISDAQGREFDKAGVRQGRQQQLAQLGYTFLNDTLNRRSNERIAQQGLGLDKAKLAQDQSQFDATLSFNQQTHKDDMKKSGGDKKQQSIEARESTKESVRTAVASAAAQLSQGRQVYSEEPVLPKFPTKQGKYVKKGGGFTNDPNEAETRPVMHVEGGADYTTIFKRMRALYAPSLARYGVKDAEINAIIQAGMTAAGMTPPAAKVKPQVRVVTVAPGVQRARNTTVR